MYLYGVNLFKVYLVVQTLELVTGVQICSKNHGLGPRDSKMDIFNENLKYICCKITMLLSLYHSIQSVSEV